MNNDTEQFIHADPKTPEPPPLARTPSECDTRRQDIEDGYEQPKPMFASFSADYTPIEGDLTIFKIADSLLKHPARTAKEILEGRSIQATLALFFISLLCMLGYGLIMGSFAGGTQYWVVPFKLAIGVFLSALICLPSLYIFTSLSGSSRSLGDTTGLLLQSLALTGILLVGFAPIVWIFSQATSTTVFMGVLHLCFWLIATWFSLRLLIAAFTHLSDCSMRVLKIWGLIFFVVLLQMSTTLRPLIGKDDGMWNKEKKFFLTHWSECFDDPKP